MLHAGCVGCPRPGLARLRAGGQKEVLPVWRARRQRADAAPSQHLLIHHGQMPARPDFEHPPGVVLGHGTAQGPLPVDDIGEHRAGEAGGGCRGDLVIELADPAVDHVHGAAHGGVVEGGIDTQRLHRGVLREGLVHPVQRGGRAGKDVLVAGVCKAQVDLVAALLGDGPLHLLLRTPHNRAHRRPVAGGVKAGHACHLLDGRADKPGQRHRLRAGELPGGRCLGEHALRVAEVPPRGVDREALGSEGI